MARVKSIIAILVCIMIVFAVTACSSGNEPEPEEEQQTEIQTESVPEEEPQTETPVETTQEPATETPAEYDIASNLRLAGGDEKLLDTDYFRITLSRGPSWDYEVDSKTAITIYNIASREAGVGGRLVSIIAYDLEDKEYEMLPSYSVIGESGGKVYVAEYPTDVQFDHENAQTEADYRAVYEEVNRIRDGGSDSPIVLK